MAGRINDSLPVLDARTKYFVRRVANGRCQCAYEGGGISFHEVSFEN
jgi:hypothetical protein